MAMATSYLNVLATAGAAAITHITVVDGAGAEFAGVARRPVSWTAAANGLIRPTVDHPFTIPSGSSVQGWRGFSAATGGVNHGGETVPTEPFPNGGTYTLLAAQTSIAHNAI